MTDVIGTIEKYWIQGILTGTSGALAWLRRRMHHWKQEQDPVK